MSVIEVLKKRGLIEAVAGEGVETLLKTPQKIYAGFDPTGECLHLGHLVPIMGLAWFAQYGHTPVAIVGGATGMVGDPSGKSQERNLLDQKTIEHNLLGVRENLNSILGSPLILNNYDWFAKFTLLDFLRDVGKHFRMGVMLAKDSVKTRLESQEGLSFTEFTYQMLQAYDFLHLFDTHGVHLQLGGSDQWGNITAGIDLIRKLRKETVFGLTFPLLKRSDGKKFGKTEEGAIWLSPSRCSPYTFYQYLFGIPDQDVISLMKMLTFLELEEIAEYEGRLKDQPNEAQKKLAFEVTRMVHGEEGLQSALRATQGAAPGQATVLDASMLLEIAKDAPSRELPIEKIVGKKIVELLPQFGMAQSRSEARRLICGGGVYLNNARIEDEGRILEQKDLLGGKVLLLAVGKKHKLVLYTN